MVFESTFFKWYLTDYSKPNIKDYWFSVRFGDEDIAEISDRPKAVWFFEILVFVSTRTDIYDKN